MDSPEGLFMSDAEHAFFMLWTPYTFDLICILWVVPSANITIENVLNATLFLIK